MMTAQERIRELETELAEVNAALAQTAEEVSANMQIINKGVQELKEMLTAARAERDALREKRQCCGKCRSPRDIV